MYLNKVALDQMGNLHFRIFLLYYAFIERAHVYRVRSLPILQHGRRGGGPGNAKRDRGQTAGVQTEPPRPPAASLLLC